MYKTIRHGENSLQYTILPQNDDFRVESGKIKLGSASGIKAQYKNKRDKRKSIFAYFGLLFICTVILGAILIPFLVSTQCLPNPTDWFTKNKNAKANLKENKNVNISFSYDKIASSSILSKTLLGSSKYSQIPDKGFSQKNAEKVTVNTQYSTKQIEYDSNYAKYSNLIDDPTFTASDQNNSQSHFSNASIKEKMHKAIEKSTLQSEDDKKIDQNVSNGKTDFRDTIIDTKTNMFKTTQSVENIQKGDPLHKIDSAINTFDKNGKPLYSPEINFASYTTLTPLINKKTVKPYVENKKVPDISNLTNKPIILPILAKANSMSKDDRNDAINEKGTAESWIKSHWPFVDPSTYFQWTGYKKEDSIILPAILGATLVSVILFASICIITRNRKINNSKSRKRNRIVKIEEAGDDNTTLLTTSSLSDDE